MAFDFSIFDFFVRREAEILARIRFGFFELFGRNFFRPPQFLGMLCKVLIKDAAHDDVGKHSVVDQYLGQAISGNRRFGLGDQFAQVGQDILRHHGLFFQPTEKDFDRHFAVAGTLLTVHGFACYSRSCSIT